MIDFLSWYEPLAARKLTFKSQYVPLSPTIVKNYLKVD
jgi:hypothetical protein